MNSKIVFRIIETTGGEQVLLYRPLCKCHNNTIELNLRDNDAKITAQFESEAARDEFFVSAGTNEANLIYKGANEAGAVENIMHQLQKQDHKIN